MIRRTYLALVLVRLYFALLPSYLHPDEYFQGPEVIAGRVFGYPIRETWEFTSDRPIRSAFTLWPVYGLPMLILKWLWEGSGHGQVPPQVVFWTLRGLMFLLSFVLGDWAIHELVDSPPQRRIAILLVASSYVTSTWQVHTFSNAVETLVVLWSLVLIKRIKEDKRGQAKYHRSSLFDPAVLAALMVFGVFNRITFPAFIFIPLLQLCKSLIQRPGILVLMATVGILSTILAVIVDTEFYAKETLYLKDIFQNPVIAPLNSLLYNSKASNLALHGTHPHHQHFLVNLPQLLGPAFLLLLTSPRFSMLLLSALSGTAVLSCFSHQEARFLLPTVPLILASIRIPQRFWKPFLIAWAGFNGILALLMGVYHQGGVVPAQIFVGAQPDVTKAIWWKTYSPPTWPLDGRNGEVETLDLMGLAQDKWTETMCSRGNNDTSVLVAPLSTTWLDQFIVPGKGANVGLQLRERWRFRQHMNLDDMDFEYDGVWKTVSRVIGRRGIGVWDINCSPSMRKRSRQ